MTKLTDAHTIVTGGSEGIGLATAEILLARGARISLVSRSEAKLAAAREQLGGQIAIVSADVTQETSITGAIAALVAERGPCDVLVSCAGAAAPGYFEQLGIDTFRTQMELNYFGTVYAIRAVVPSMIERGRGHLVLVASTAALLGVFGYSAYTPTKFAVRGLGESLRAELAPHGIVVSIVYPPDTDTPGFEHENLTKPVETAAISAAIKPVPAQRVASAIVRGVERDRLTITADAQTAVLARAGGLLGPIVRASMARTVRKAQQRRD
jgi:3-dehydrosphinganine reductase